MWPLLFLASLAGLFPGFALPVVAGWKAVSFFDVAFAGLTLRALRHGLAPLDRRLITSSTLFGVVGLLAFAASPTDYGIRGVVATGYSIVVLLVAAHLRIGPETVKRAILTPLAIAIVLAWVIFAIENGLGIVVGDNVSTALPHGPHRLGGFTGGNALILFICLGAPLASQSWRGQMALLLSGYVTLSRALAGVGVATLLSPRNGEKVGPRRLVGGLASIAIVASVLAYAFAIREVPQTSGTEGWITASLEPGTYRIFNTAALRMFWTAPLLGLGPGAFAGNFRNFTSEAEQELVGQGRVPYWDPHSAILGLAAEQGALGIASFSWLLFEIFRRLARHRNAIPRRQTVAALLGLLIGGHFVDWIPLKGLWLWIGLLLAGARDEREELPAERL